MNSEEIHLRDYVKVISKRRGMVILFMLVVFAMFVFGTFSMTPQYLGTTKVMIEKAASNSLTEQQYRSNYRDPQFYETQFQLIKSQEVMRRVVALLSLEKTYDTYLGGTEESSTLLSIKTWLRQMKSTLKNALFSALQLADDKEQIAAPQRSRTDEIAEMIVKDIEVAPVKESRIAEISFSSANPEFAALIANTVVKAYIETTLEMKMDATRRTLEWMTIKVDQERQKLEKTEQELQFYVRSNDLVSLESHIGVLPQKLSEISTHLVQAQNKRETLEALYRKIKRVAQQPEAVEAILEITNGQTLQILRAQILKAEQTIREMSNKFMSKHPTMIKAKGDLDILQSKRKLEIRRLIESVKSEYELSVTNENNLRQQLEKTKAEVHNLNERFIQYSAYKREVETSQHLYDALLSKMKEQTITGETQPINLWVVERAIAPLKPFKPRKVVNLLLGLIVGLFGGIGLAFFIEYLDQGIKYPEETELALGVPVLGMVCLYKEKKGQIETIMMDQPRSILAENFRALRTSLLLSASERPPRKILITSATAEAGKSTTSINLAVALAQSGKKVLLIDGDMRKPRLHKILEAKTTYGLSSYLTGQSDGDILQHTKVDNLTLVTSGPIPPNPSELLQSDRMKNLVEKLSKDYDFIICDSPPLQSVVDGRILSQLFDGTVLVVRAKKTTFDMARRAIKQLQNTNTPVLGVMINGMELKKNDYYYESYYVSYGDEPQSG